MLHEHVSRSSSRALGLSIALISLLAFATPTFAHTYVYEGLFAPEGGPGSSGSGTARLTIDTDLFLMRVEATFTGLSSNATLAHVHCCTASPGTGNVGVATVLPSFTAFPTGVTSGSYDFTYDMSLASSFAAAFITNNGGGSVAGAFNALIVGLDEDRAYFNIHTVDFPAGEIRARMALVPEPSTAVLVALGTSWLAASARRRRVPA